MNVRDSLKARIDTLSPMAVRFVARLVDSLSEAPRPNTVTPTWLTEDPEWIEYFGLAISARIEVGTGAGESRGAGGVP